MKLSGMFRIGFVAAIVTALILLPSCIAAGGNDMAASSSTSQSSHPTRPWPPRKVNKYIEYLNDVNTIKQLPPGSFDQRNIPFFYSDFPTLLKTPLYSIDTPTTTVEQALRDRKSVGIVDASKREARLIQVLDDGHQSYLAQGLFPNVEPGPIQLFKLDPALHHVRQLVQNPRNDEPPEASTKYLPHANGHPILSQGSETLGHMLHAARTDPRSFYYFQEGMKPILVVPHKNELISNLDRAEEKQLRRIMDGYQIAKRKYGQTIASIIWGRPIIASSDRNGLRMSSSRQSSYAWLSHDAPREQMVTELRRNGGFYVYRGDYKYKVMVTNPEASQGEAFGITVDRIAHGSRVRLPL
ncbi:uncharacterized protein UDID_19518 [Ustilago sp. UG-2017a]|nr:uncharacterized protein UDID_19518 [Ustilago sp. UG-2017a]